MEGGPSPAPPPCPVGVLLDELLFDAEDDEEEDVEEEGVRGLVLGTGGGGAGWGVVGMICRDAVVAASRPLWWCSGLMLGDDRLELAGDRGLRMVGPRTSLSVPFTISMNWRHLRVKRRLGLRSRRPG